MTIAFRFLWMTRVLKTMMQFSYKSGTIFVSGFSGFDIFLLAMAQRSSIHMLVGCSGSR